MKAVDVTGGERMPWRVWLTRHGRKANRAFIKRQGCLKRVCPEFCTDAKPYKHTQKLTLRKVGGIVRFLKGWCGAKGWCGNPSGSRPNFFGRQHLTFDKGAKCGGAEQGIVRF